MPTPIGHALSSLVISVCAERSLAAPKPKWPIYLSILGASCIHDITYPIFRLFGLNLGHREITHSILLVLPVALIFAILFHYWYQSAKVGVIYGSIAWLLHIFLDMASSLTGPKILYPLWDERIDLPIHFLPVAEVRVGSLAFNTVCIAFECMIFLSIYVMVVSRRRMLPVLFLTFALLGSVRQSNFRSHIWFEAPKDKLEVYLKNLDAYSPLHFALFKEGEEFW